MTIIILLFLLYLIDESYIWESRKNIYFDPVYKNATNTTKQLTKNEKKRTNVTRNFEELITNEKYSCYHKYNLESETFLLQDIHKSKIQPKSDTIFFIISSCFKNNLIQIGKR